MSEPFYIRQTTLADLSQHQTASDWFDACAAEVHGQGGQWVRASWSREGDDGPGILLVEGWHERPTDQGSPRFILIDGAAA